MIVAPLTQKGGVGKTTPALHLAGHWARQGKHVIDADPQGSALDWSEQCARRHFERLSGVVDLVSDTLHREASELRDAHHVVIDDPPRVPALLRSVLLAAKTVLVPAQPSPFDGWACADVLSLIGEARIFRPLLIVLRAQPLPRAHDYCPQNGSEPRGSQSACTRRAHQPARVILADVSHIGQLVFEQSDRGAAYERSLCSPPRPKGSRHDRVPPERWLLVPPALRGVKNAAFQRGETVAEMLRALLARKFPEADGGKS